MTKAITKNSKKGFTLVELVVVIAILAILAAIAIPVVNSIINTASKNGALANAESIELGIKECQADIAARNNEVYNGTTTYSFTDPAGTSITGSLPNIATAHGSITVQDVAGAKGIPDAFETITYNGNDYEPQWDTASDKCVYIGVTGGAAAGWNLETGAAYVGGTLSPLAPGGTIATTTIASL